MSTDSLIIKVDQREQLPFSFNGSEDYKNIVVVTGLLNVGDYSVQGLENKVAIERKSLPDLVLCLGRERDRFERELERARALESFAVVVEADWKDLVTGNYRSQLNPKAGCASVAAFLSRGTPFFFAGTRASAEWVTYLFLKFYASDRMKELRALEKAMSVQQGGVA